MEKRNTTNTELDRIGIAVLRASALRDGELDRVIGDPDLFSSVKRRIRLDGSQRPKIASVGFNFFSVRSITGGLSMAVIAITVFALVSMKFLNTKGVEAVRLQQPQSTMDLPVAAGESPADPEPRPMLSSPKRTYQAEPAVIKTRAPHRVYAETVAETEPESRTMEFYPLAGTSPDAMGEGRIVRVELPRASLVALGANLPPDSGKQLVRTDLLVGQDGIPRAIRLVD